MHAKPPRSPERRRPAPSGAAARALRVAGLGVAALVLACGGGSAPPERPRANLVLIVLDTVRADHLGCYGYARDTSPRIDAFARGATLYRHAIATAPWTLPSHASLFTGLFPFEHGVHTYPPQGTEENIRPLDSSYSTLAELLQRDGYLTAAFVANTAFLAPVYGLDQGFSSWVLDRSPALRLNRRILDWLDEARERPFFLFVNYMDAHRVYNTDGRRSFEGPPDPADRGEPLERLIQTVLPGERDAPPDLAQRVIDQYDTAIAGLDDAVDELLRKLDRLGIDGETLVVVTSDHGEAFGEHRLVEHAQDVYQETLAVPLLIRAPGQRAGGSVDRPVTSADVPYLVLDALAPGLSPGTLAGFAPPPARGLAIAENYLSRSRWLHDRRWGHRFRRNRHALVEWPYKLIASSDGRNELYHLELDPAELADRLAAEPEVAARLRGALRLALERPRGHGSSSDAVAPDEELRARLEALGYL